MRGKVYVLGAGASRNDTSSSKYPLPLATEFFHDRYVRAFWPGGLAKFRKSALGRVLSQYFGGHAKPDVLVNVEEVYSFLDRAPSLVGRQFVDKEVWSDAQSELRTYITRVIRETSFLAKDARFYPWLARELQKDDSIITFNWDTLLDDVLLTIEDPHPLLARWWSLLTPTFPLPHQALDTVDKDIFDDVARPHDAGGNLIKLHGSINVVRCANLLCRRHVSPFHLRNVASLDDPDLKCPECHAELDVLIVPPHVHKSYLTDIQAAFLASVAAWELAVAAEIIIVGYSFPDFDFEVQSLFRAARLEPWEVGESRTNLRRVVLVNPQIKDARYIEKVENLLGVRKVAAHGNRITLVKYETIDDFLTV